MQELSIKVTIAERQYPLKIQASDEENVRRAAKRVNDILKEYHENFEVSDKQDALALIALEMATELGDKAGSSTVNAESERALQAIEEKLDNLIDS